MNILNTLRNDENGFIVSAELVLVGTICVIGMIVGLTELSYGVNEELEDLAPQSVVSTKPTISRSPAAERAKLLAPPSSTSRMNAITPATLTCNSGASGEKGSGNDYGYNGRR